MNSTKTDLNLVLHKDKPYFFTLSVADQSYSRNASCAINMIFNMYYYHWITIMQEIDIVLLSFFIISKAQSKYYRKQTNHLHDISEKCIFLIIYTYY